MELFTSTILSNDSEAFETTTLLDADTTTEYLLENSTVTTPIPTKVSTSVNFLPLGLIILILCIFGLIGNLLSTLVLFRFKANSTYSLITLGLTACDAFYLLIKLIRFGLASCFDYFEIFPGYRVFLLIIGPYIRALNFAAQTASSYVTIAVALDRFLMVCWPLKSRSFWTRKKAKGTIAIMIIFSYLYNIPRWFEFTTLTSINPDTNETIYIKLQPTSLRSNAQYKRWYIFWAYLFVMDLIPFAVLSYFNLKIWRAIQEAKKSRKTMTSQQKQENSFGLMLIAVVIVYLICNLGFFATDVMNQLGINYSEFWERLANVTLTTNFAINFILYCSTGTKFRLEFIAMLREWQESINSKLGASIKLRCLEPRARKSLQESSSNNMSTTKTSTGPGAPTTIKQNNMKRADSDSGVAEI